MWELLESTKMEVLRAKSRRTRSSGSSVLCGAAEIGSAEGSNNRDAARSRRRSRGGGGEDTQKDGYAPTPASRVGFRKSLPPQRVLAHLLQLDATQRQHLSIPSTGSADIFPTLVAGTARAVDVPASSASCSYGETVFSRFAAAVPSLARPTVAGGSLSASAPPEKEATSSTVAAVARLAGAALASEVAAAPALLRPFTVEEETQEQLSEEEEATGTAASDSTTPIVHSAATQEARGPVPRSMLPDQPRREPACQRGETSAPGSLLVPQRHREGEEGGSAPSPPKGSPAAVPQNSSTSLEVVESCVVPWKPTCLTEISFDYSVHSMQGGGGITGSRSLYESLRSTTSEPTETSPTACATAVSAGAGACMSAAATALISAAAAANAVSASLSHKWPSLSLGLPEQTAANPPAAQSVYKRQASVHSESDGAVLTSTEGMPSNVSRWRLAVTPAEILTQRQQDKPVEEQEERQHQQKALGVFLQHQQDICLDGEDLRLQQHRQQLEEEMKQQKLEGKEEQDVLQQKQDQDVLQQKQDQDVVHKLLQQQLKVQGMYMEHKENPATDQQQVFETQQPLPPEHIRALLLLQGEQQCKPGEQQVQRQQIELLQKQRRMQEHVELLDPEHFCSRAVQQLQQDQQGQVQQEGCVLEPQHTLEEASVEQAPLSHRQHQSLHVCLQQDREGLEILQQAEHHHNHRGSADVEYKAAVLATPTVGAVFTTEELAPAATPPAEIAAEGDVLEESGGDDPAAATAAAAENEGKKPRARTPRKRYSHPRVRRRKKKTSKGGRFVQTSSSGYPGVSWNRRMGAWLAFFYDTQSRRSRTFHPRYFNGDVEATRIAAIEFKKSVDRLFASASKNGGGAKLGSLQQEQRNDEAEEKAQQEGLQDKDNQQQHLLSIHLGSLPQQLSELAASLLPLQKINMDPTQQQLHCQEEQQEGFAGGEEQGRAESSSNAMLITSQFVPARDGDGAGTDVAIRQKKGKQDYMEGSLGAAAAGCLLSQCFALSSSHTATELASALLTSTTPSNAAAAALGGDAAATFTSEAVLSEKPSAATVADVTSLHVECGNAAGFTDPLRKENDDKEACESLTAAPAAFTASPASAVTATASPSVPELDLSVLAAMGSHERLRKALSSGADLQNKWAHRLGFPWNRLSTLSAENLQLLAKNSTSNLQVLTQEAEPVPPGTGERTIAGAEAAKEEYKTIAPAVFQLLTQAQAEKQGPDDRHTSNAPNLLQQLQFNESAGAATVGRSEPQLDDAPSLQESTKELHRILEQSYSLLPLWETNARTSTSSALLCSGETRLSDGKDVDPSATVGSGLQVAETRKSSQNETSPACQRSNCGTGTVGDSCCLSSISSSSSSRKTSSYSNSRVDGGASTCGIDSQSSSNKSGRSSSAAVMNVENTERFGGTQEQDAWSSSLEKIRRFLSEGERACPAGEKDADNGRASTASLLAHAQSIIGGSFCADTFPSESLLKHAVDAFDLHWRSSGGEGKESTAPSSCQRHSLSSNSSCKSNGKDEGTP